LYIRVTSQFCEGFFFVVTIADSTFLLGIMLIKKDPGGGEGRGEKWRLETEQANRIFPEIFPGFSEGFS
jgi:hypothetical protein